MLTTDQEKELFNSLQPKNNEFHLLQGVQEKLLAQFYKKKMYLHNSKCTTLIQNNITPTFHKNRLKDLSLIHIQMCIRDRPGLSILPSQRQFRTQCRRLVSVNCFRNVVKVSLSQQIPAKLISSIKIGPFQGRWIYGCVRFY